MWITSSIYGYKYRILVLIYTLAYTYTYIYTYLIRVYIINSTNKNMTKEQAQNVLEYMKSTGEYTAHWNGEIITAEEVLSITKGRAVTYQQAINYLCK